MAPPIRTAEDWTQKVAAEAQGHSRKWRMREEKLQGLRSMRTVEAEAG